MVKKQQFGIKYPFRSEGFEHYFLDTNNSVKDKVRSQLMHVVFTPKGQRLRLPNFGTDLIKSIFEQDDTVSWEAVKNEISESVRMWISNVVINNIQVIKNEEDEHEIYVRLDYSVTEGNKVTNDSLVVQI